MDLLGFLNWLFSHSLYQLWLPIVRSFGFQTPLTLLIIVVHNVFAVAYLALLSALAYPIFGRRAWMLSCFVVFLWIFTGTLYLSFGMLSNVLFVLTGVLPHGWLEFTAIFYWVYSIRCACKGFHLESEASMSTFSDYASSFRSPRVFVSLIGYDLRSVWGTTELFFRELSRCGMERKFLKVLLLLVISAFIEVYVTPMLVPI